MTYDVNSKFGLNHFPVIDGEIVRNALSANSGEGWVEVIIGYKQSGRPITEMRFGKVTYIPVNAIEDDPYESFYR